MSVDPLTKSYPELTPYQFASNSPVSGIDLDGKEFLLMITPQYTSGNMVVSAQVSEVDLTKSVKDIEFLAHHIGAENMKNIINNYKQEDRNKLNFIMAYNHESAMFEYTGNMLAAEVVGEKIDKYAYGKFGPFTFHSDGWYENDEDGLKHGLQRINDVANVMTSAATLGEGTYLINSGKLATEGLIYKGATYTSMGLSANYLAEQATGTNLLNNTLTKLIGEENAKNVEIGLNLYSGFFGSIGAIKDFKKNGGISPGAVGDIKGTIETTSKILSKLY